MSTTLSPPAQVATPPLTGPTFYRLSVDQYHQMIRHGTLSERDPVELLEGLLVRKMPEDPVHAGLIDIVADALARVLPAGWIVRPAHPITTADSEPEPDVVVARGARRDYLQRHPEPQDCAIVIEIANTSVSRDRGWKRDIYAQAGVATYWVVLIADRVVEVYAQRAGPAYAAVRRFADGDRVPVVVDGVEVGSVAVADLLP